MQAKKQQEQQKNNTKEQTQQNPDIVYSITLSNGFIASTPNDIERHSTYFGNNNYR